MRKIEVYKMGSPYREDLSISEYSFGHGRRSACIVGSIRGNEVQQLDHKEAGRARGVPCHCLGQGDTGDPLRKPPCNEYRQKILAGG